MKNKTKEQLAEDAITNVDGYEVFVEHDRSNFIKDYDARQPEIDRLNASLEQAKIHIDNLRDYNLKLNKQLQNNEK